MPHVVDYLQNQWITKHKERFVYAWTSLFRHLEHITSARIEGAHSRLKKYIEVSSGDLFTLFERIFDAYVNEMIEIRAEIAQQRNKKSKKHRDSIFADVQMKISYYALNKTYEWYSYMTWKLGQANQIWIKQHVKRNCTIYINVDISINSKKNSIKLKI